MEFGAHLPQMTWGDLKPASNEAAGAERIVIWPVSDVLHQLERFSSDVMARLDAG